MKKTKKVSNIVLVAAIIAVVGYGVAAYIFQIIREVELSPTLTTAWFGFWGCEIVALAAIKTSKVKHGADGDVETEEDINDE